MSIVVDDNVFGFDIPVDDFLGVQIFKRSQDFNKTIASFILLESFHLSKIIEKLSSRAI